MQDLQLIGVHEDGEHLLLSGPYDERFLVPVDESLRAAIRRDRPRLGQPQPEVDGGLRPRDVQALVRAGVSAEEVADRAGWPVEKVHRYESPILAEREHVAGLARKARLRTRSGASGGGSAPTLSTRVSERLKARGVDATDAGWDSWRVEGGPWTVVLTFAAGGRQRQASWSFDLADRTVTALDDEARWLSEEEEPVKGPIPARRLGSALVETSNSRETSNFRRATTVYDVEAEGGLQSTARVEAEDDPLDLMTAMRKRSSARGRRKPGGSRGSAKAATKTANNASSAGDPPPPQPIDQPLPLDDLTYDAETGTSSPDRHHPDPEPLGDQDRPGSEAAAALAKPADPAEAAVPFESSPPAHREATRKPGRPSVPAWDDIMFGSKPR